MNARQDLGHVSSSGLALRVAAEVDRIHTDLSPSRRITPFQRMDDGTPVVKASVGRCSPGFDLWHGLRHPAGVGLFPIGLTDIWRYYRHLASDTSMEKLSRTGFAGTPLMPGGVASPLSALVVAIMLPVADAHRIWRSTCSGLTLVL